MIGPALLTTVDPSRIRKDSYMARQITSTIRRVVRAVDRHTLVTFNPVVARRPR
jgi:hypothetical protein